MNFVFFILCGVLATFPVFGLVNQVFSALTFSFLLVSVPLSFWLWFAAKEGNLINSSIFVFFALFFVIAPVLQLSTNSQFLVNTMPFNEVYAVRVNVYTLLFLTSYSVAYKYFGYHAGGSGVTVYPVFSPNYRVAGLFLLLGLSVVIALYALLNIFDFSSQFESGVFIYKVMYVIPFLTFLYFVRAPISRRDRFLALLVLLICVFLTKNPLFERRNAIGPVYLVMLIFAFPKIVSDCRKFVLFFCFVMFFGFPVASVFTHNLNWDAIDFGYFVTSVYSHFNQLHYDAWANFVAVLQIVELKGFSYGYQLLGSFLFFIPRFIWESKPDPTGFLIGEHLLDYHSMWFTNLSSPLVSEAFLDFGLFGLIFYPIFVAFIAVHLRKNGFIRRGGWLVAYFYFAFYVIFMLRGSLLPAVVYFSGFLIALWLTEKIAFKRLRTIKSFDDSPYFRKRRGKSI